MAFQTSITRSTAAGNRDQFRSVKEIHGGEKHVNKSVCAEETRGQEKGDCIFTGDCRRTRWGRDPWVRSTGHVCYFLPINHPVDVIWQFRAWSSILGVKSTKDESYKREGEFLEKGGIFIGTVDATNETRLHGERGYTRGDSPNQWGWMRHVGTWENMSSVEDGLYR